MGEVVKETKAPRAKTAKAPLKKPVKGTITGPAGFALLRLAKKSGVYEFYKDLLKRSRDASEGESALIGLEIMLGISERLVDCETEFWEAAALVYGVGPDEVKGMDFEVVLADIVPELMEPGMISFFTKTQAESGK